MAALSILIETRIFFSQSLEATRGEDGYEDGCRFDGKMDVAFFLGGGGMGLSFFVGPQGRPRADRSKWSDGAPATGFFLTPISGLING